MGVAPESFADLIMPAPGRSRQHRGWVFGIGFDEIDASDVVPVHDFGGTAADEIIVETLDDADGAIEALQVDVVFGIPDWFAHPGSHLLHLRRSGNAFGPF